MNDSDIDAAADLIRAEYAEMPGMRLTAAQVQRLCGVSSSACAEAVSRLVAEHSLVANSDGTFSRPSEGSEAPSRPVVS